MNKETLFKVLADTIEQVTLKRIVLSRSRDKSTLKADAKLVMLKKGMFLQIAVYSADGKVHHTNVPAADGAQAVLDLFLENFRQINILAQGGECQALQKSDGTVSVNNKIKSASAAPQEIAGHNAEKQYILQKVPTPFLEKLGIMDKNGRVYDKRMAKFRQINRFLEMVRDMLARLDVEGEIVIYDLCCGKGYLTFAVYHYITNILGKTVHMYGVDRKADVMKTCADVAMELGFENLHFICDDIENVRPKRKVDIVMALHACDIATDIALAHAVKWNARGILSAPCCQHELAGQINPEAVGGLLRQPLLRYRFAQLATDALRVQVLEICGYFVQAVEFTDPDDTDKNLMIRAVKKSAPTPPKKRQELLDEYLAQLSSLGVSPTLANLLHDKLNG